MFEKNGKFYADWRDRSGKRIRKSFNSPRAALTYEQQQKEVARPKPKALGRLRTALLRHIPPWRSPPAHRTAPRPHQPHRQSPHPLQGIAQGITLEVFDGRRRLAIALCGSGCALRPQRHRERGSLVVQQEPAARLARVLNNAAMELWDGCTSDDADSMWEEAGAIASRILASCRSAKVTNLRNYPGIQFVSPKFPC